MPGIRARESHQRAKRTGGVGLGLGWHDRAAWMGGSGGFFGAAALHVECLDEAGNIARLTNGIHQPRAADHWKDSAGGAGVQLCVRLVDPERPQDGGEIVKWRQTRLLFLHVVPLSLNVNEGAHASGVDFQPTDRHIEAAENANRVYGNPITCPWRVPVVQACKPASPVSVAKLSRGGGHFFA